MKYLYAYNKTRFIGGKFAGEQRQPFGEVFNEGNEIITLMLLHLTTLDGDEEEIRFFFSDKPEEDIEVLQGLSDNTQGFWNYWSGHITKPQDDNSPEDIRVLGAAAYSEALRLTDRVEDLRIEGNMAEAGRLTEIYDALCDSLERVTGGAPRNQTIDRYKLGRSR